MTCNNCQCNNNNEEIEEFDEDREYAIGEFFKVENEVFKVVRGSSIWDSNCDLPHEIRCQSKWECFDRKDMADVEFILYDTLENE